MWRTKSAVNAENKDLSITTTGKSIVGSVNQCRCLYNLALAERRAAYLKGERINYQVQQNELVLLKKQYLEFGMVYSKVLQMALNTLDSDYRSFFALRRNRDVLAKPPHFKSRDYFTPMAYNQSGFKVERGCVKLSHKHPSRESSCFAIPESFAFKKVFQVTVFQKVKIVKEENNEKGDECC